ncbi:MAG: ComF family protein [Isosphaeraceae bacterium]
MFRTELIRRWSSACLEAVDTLLFPLPCLICGEDGLAAPFCDPCRAELLESSGRMCGRCAMPIGPWEQDPAGCSECRGKSLGFDGAVALGPYQGPIRHLCLQLKRDQNAWLAPWLSELLIESRGEVLRRYEGARVVPVPLHWQRRWVRGYNQSEALGYRLARRLGVRLVRPLQRVVSTPALAELSRAERAKAMRGVFRVRDPRSIEGRTVLLVDDILTTGATCGSAARALKRAGATKVIAVVIGRAEGRA